MVAIVAASFSAVGAAYFPASTVKCYGGGIGRSKTSEANPFPRIPYTVSESYRKTQLMIPIYISTNPSAVKLEELRQLYSLCNLSGHRFPKIDPESGRNEELVDLEKLRIALSHSPVVVSAFCKATDLGKEVRSKREDEKGLVRNMLERVVPVIPSLQGRGIGRMIVNRIVRMLISRGIYDIAALCSEEERFFFKACGFGDDILSSTTMMYTRAFSDFQNDQVVTRAGRKLLLAPPAKEPFASISS